MTDYEQRSDGYTAVEDQYAGYTVVDETGAKIGKVDDLFLDESDRPEYFGVKMGFLGTRSTLIPADITTINNEQGFIEVSQSKDTVKNGPAFDDDREITSEYENEVRSYYGLGAVDSTEDRGTYGDYDGERPRGRGRAEGAALRRGAQGRHPRARGRGHEGPQARKDRPRAHRGADQARGSVGRAGTRRWRGDRSPDRRGRGIRAGDRGRGRGRQAGRGQGRDPAAQGRGRRHRDGRGGREARGGRGRGRHRARQRHRPLGVVFSGDALQERAHPLNFARMEQRLPARGGRYWRMKNATNGPRRSVTRKIRRSNAPKRSSTPAQGSARPVR